MQSFTKNTIIFHLQWDEERFIVPTFSLLLQVRVLRLRLSDLVKAPSHAGTMTKMRESANTSYMAVARATITTSSRKLTVSVNVSKRVRICFLSLYF